MIRFSSSDPYQVDIYFIVDLYLNFRTAYWRADGMRAAGSLLRRAHAGWVGRARGRVRRAYAGWMGRVTRSLSAAEGGNRNN